MTRPRPMDWPLVLGTATLALAVYYLYPSSRSTKQSTDETNEDSLDQPLLKHNSSFRSYTTSHATYPAIRTFYHPHAHKEKLQAIGDLPLLVFIHGLGGVLPQFCPLLGSLANVSPCFGIELPGHGRSAFEPRNYAAYTTQAFAELWKEAISQACLEHGHTRVVLVGHSMGCSLAAMLATEMDLEQEITGVVALCPKSHPPLKRQSLIFRTILSLPDFALDALRWLDKRGGEESASVKRFVGEGAGLDLKRLQLKYNAAFSTPVWKRSAKGAIPYYDSAGHPHGGLPGRDTWSKIQTPLFLISGAADPITPSKDLTEIVSFLQHKPSRSDKTGQTSNTPELVPVTEATTTATASSTADDRSYGLLPSTTTTTKHLTSYHSVPVKTAILPAPASHALMYDHAIYRTVAGLIEDFLARYVSPHLSLGWQLTQLTTSGKWDVKNLEKWKRTLAVSAPIPASSGIFRALKTLREQDEEHTPLQFIARWSDSIGAVVDISHDAPVYDTKALERGGIAYHKFPTVSKVPPTVVEVHDFIALIDRLHAELDTKQQSVEDKAGEKEGPGGKKTYANAIAIAVHCHYGYNRTGFFICCYLIEKLGFSVPQAIEEFARAKPPGIKHEHFIDTLYVRYCVGLKRAASMKVEAEAGDDSANADE